jgi:hypothetical protein
MAEEREDSEIGVSEGEFVVLPDAKSIPKPGKIFIEACIKDDILNNPNVTPVENFQQKVVLNFYITVFFFSLPTFSRSKMT